MTKTLRSMMKSEAGKQTSSKKNNKLLKTKTCFGLSWLSNLNKINHSFKYHYALYIV